MFLRMFGIGCTNAIADSKTTGTVIEVQTCYWFKVNTKPVRTHAWDGAVYPHIIRFSYQAGGQTYIGKRWVSWNRRCPVKDEKITVYYEREYPENYAVLV